MTVFGFRGDTKLRGAELIGREIIIRWETGLWYDAIVVQYYDDEDEHKIVYRYDDGIEITRLTNRRWTLLAKKSARVQKKPVLDGAVVRFVYPNDGKIYKGMIYDHNNTGSIIKIAYLTEHSTDVLKGCEWDFVTQSPCSLDVGQPDPSAMSSSSTQLDDSPQRRPEPRSSTRRAEHQVPLDGRVRSQQRSSNRRAEHQVRLDRPVPLDGPIPLDGRVRKRRTRSRRS